MIWKGKQNNIKISKQTTFLTHLSMRKVLIILIGSLFIAEFLILMLLIDPDGFSGLLSKISTVENDKGTKEATLKTSGLELTDSFGGFTAGFSHQSANISTDGKMLYYTFDKDGKMFIGTGIKDRDIEVKAPVDYIPERGFAMSQDGKHYAYAREYKDNNSQYWSAVDIDEREITDYIHIRDLILSPDGNHFAFTADMRTENNVYDPNNSPRYVVLDGIKGKGYDRIFSLTFSPDSQHFAYRAEGRIDDNFIVLDGKEIRQGGDNFDLTAPFAFSPDGKHVAYTIFQSDIGEPSGYFVDLDGQRSGPYNWAGKLTFSADSQHLLYDIEEKDIPGRFVMLDGKTVGNAYSLLAASPDFKHFAFRKTYSSEDPNRKGFSTAVVPTKETAVIDGKEDNRQFDFTLPVISIGSFVFSPNGQSYAYVATQAAAPNGYSSQYRNGEKVGVAEAAKKFVVVGNTADVNAANDIVTEENGEISDLVLSPDGKHVAYKLTKKIKGLFGESTGIYVVVDRKRSEKYKEIYLPAFGPDSKNFSYYADINSTLWQKTVQLE